MRHLLPCYRVNVLDDERNSLAQFQANPRSVAMINTLHHGDTENTERKLITSYFL